MMIMLRNLVQSIGKTDVKIWLQLATTNEMNRRYFVLHESAKYTLPTECLCITYEYLTISFQE